VSHILAPPRQEAALAGRLAKLAVAGSIRTYLFGLVPLVDSGAAMSSATLAPLGLASMVRSALRSCSPCA
jgi:hypothetical protein